MGAAGNLDWVFRSIGGVLAALAALWLIWAMFRDRSRGRRRCPGCWYDMAGTPGLRCPECGRTAKHERRLFATRRRWKHAAGAVVMAGAGGCVALVPAYRAGWQTLVPTSVLAFIAPAEDPTGAGVSLITAGAVTTGSGAGAPVLGGVPVVGRFFTPPVLTPAETLTQEMWERLAMGRFSAWQGRVFVCRYLEAHPVLGGVPVVGRFFTPPVLTPAETLTQEMWERLAMGRFSAWQGRVFVRRYLEAHPHDFAGAVLLPQRWPVGVPLLVRLGQLQPTAFGQANIAARVRIESGKVWGSMPLGERLDAVMAVTDEVRMVVELVRGKSVLHREMFSVACEIRPDDELFLDHVAGEPIDARVREALSPQLAWGPTGRGAFITRDRTTAAKWRLLDLGISFDIELRQGSVVLARGHGAAEWNRPVWKDWEDIDPAWEAGGLERAIAAGPGYAGMTFHVRGDPGEARKQYMVWPWGKRPACWAGEFEAAVGRGAEQQSSR